MTVRSITEHWPRRVDSSAHRSSSAPSPRGHAGEHRRDAARAARSSSRARRRGSSWWRRGAARRHGRCPACVRGSPMSAQRRAISSRKPPRSRSAGRSARSSPTASLEAREGGAFGLLLVRTATAAMRAGCTNASAPSSWSSSCDEAVEPGRLRGAIADPTREAEPVADPAGEPNASNVPSGPELGELEVERVIEVAEIRLHVLGAEQIVRHRAHAGEQLLGQLAHEHAVVGDALARVASRAARRSARQARRARTRTGSDHDPSRPSNVSPSSARAAASAATGSSCRRLVPGECEGRARRGAPVRSRNRRAQDGPRWQPRAKTW